MSAPQPTVRDEHGRILSADPLHVLKLADALQDALSAVLLEIAYLIEDGTLRAEHVNGHPSIIAARAALKAYNEGV